MADEGHDDGNDHNHVDVSLRDADQTVDHNVKHAGFRQNTEVQDCEDTKQDGIEYTLDALAGEIQDFVKRVAAQQTSNDRNDNKWDHQVHFLA